MTSPAARPSATALNVLVVEDHLLHQTHILNILHQLGCVSTFCVNGVQALQQIQKFGFDAIIMDMQMPVMDGLEATRIIRSLHPAKADTLIIGLTSDRDDEARRQALEAGIDEFISKPVDTGRLKAALERQRAHAALRRQPLV